MRVHTLAKELGQSSKDMVEELLELGIEVKNHMSNLNDEQVAHVKDMLFGDALTPDEIAKQEAEAEAATKESAAEETQSEVPEEETPDQTPPKDEPVVETPVKSTPAKKTQPPAPETPTPKAPAPPVEKPGKKPVKKTVKPAAPTTKKPAPPAPSSPATKTAATKQTAATTEATDAIVDGVMIIKGSGILVKEFAEKLSVRPNQLIAELMGMNIFASINQNLDLKTAQEIGTKHGVKVDTEKKKIKEHKQQIAQPKKKAKKSIVVETSADIKPRPPIVTFMGHVDHGKTSLLDKIRSARVANKETGGITQHIGAYTVEKDGKEITFLDTPGHAAFTKMRMRGADVTDLVIVVIAADDGIKPQTREAIQHAQAANVTIMIAINKVDLASANVDRVKTQLQQEGLLPEDWGGETITVSVSAQTGEGIDELLEYISLQAEIMELKANANAPAEGFVIEAQRETGRGPTATVLVTKGTLKAGDSIVSGTAWGRVKALTDDKNKNVKKAPPSHAAKIMGLSDVPFAGASFSVYKNDKMARAEAEERAAAERLENLSLQNIDAPQGVTLEELLAQTTPADFQEINLLLKADVQGSLEAIEHTIDEINSDKVKVKFIAKGVGKVTDNDVLLATASKALIVAFNVTPDNSALKIAKREGVEVRTYDIIYQLADDIKLAMEGLLEPELKESLIGRAEIRQVFELNRKGNVAGCMVIEGKIFTGSRARLLRNRKEIYNGEMDSLRRFQDDVKEVRDGQECGIGLKRFNAIQTGDIIEVFREESVKASL